MHRRGEGHCTVFYSITKIYLPIFIVRRAPQTPIQTFTEHLIARYKEYKGVLIIPTTAQTLTCFVLSYWATKMYLPIFIIRIDERTGEVFFLAGEETAILIFRNGLWRFL